MTMAPPRPGAACWGYVVCLLVGLLAPVAAPGVCLRETDCTDAETSVCNNGTTQCERCVLNSDCGHIPGKPVCDLDLGCVGCEDNPTAIIVIGEESFLCEELEPLKGDCEVPMAQTYCKRTCDSCSDADRFADCKNDETAEIAVMHKGAPTTYFCNELLKDLGDCESREARLRCPRACGTCDAMDSAECIEIIDKHALVTIGDDKIFCDEIYSEECEIYPKIREKCCVTCSWFAMRECERTRGDAGCEPCSAKIPKHPDYKTRGKWATSEERAVGAQTMVPCIQGYSGHVTYKCEPGGYWNNVGGKCLKNVGMLCNRFPIGERVYAMVESTANGTEGAGDTWGPYVLAGDKGTAMCVNRSGLVGVCWDTLGMGEDLLEHEGCNAVCPNKKMAHFYQCRHLTTAECDTDTGTRCIFPFMWDGQLRDRCISDEEGSWCSYEEVYVEGTSKQGRCHSTCPDANECKEGRNECVEPAKCVNLAGGHTCSCPVGSHLTADGKSCEDNDECQDRTLDIDAEECLLLQKCVNLSIDENIPGEYYKGKQYECRCIEGYEPDGELTNGCKDINECEADGEALLCDPHARCTNFPGGYRCQCRAELGYVGEGKLDSGGCECRSELCRNDENS